MPLYNERRCMEMTFKSNRRYATFEQDRSEFNEYCKEIKAANKRLHQAIARAMEERKGGERCTTEMPEYP